jgi:hypothetical protein
MPALVLPCRGRWRLILKNGGAARFGVVVTSRFWIKATLSEQCYRYIYIFVTNRGARAFMPCGARLKQKVTAKFSRLRVAVHASMCARKQGPQTARHKLKRSLYTYLVPIFGQSTHLITGAIAVQQPLQSQGHLYPPPKNSLSPSRHGEHAFRRACRARQSNTTLIL